MNLFEPLSRTRSIWVSFTITLILTLGFGLAMHVWQFLLIDEMYDADRISIHIDGMTATQKTVHIWLTSTLDVAYPFAYASFFIGLTIRVFPKYSAWLVIPSVLVVPVDLTEGFSQIMLLSGHSEMMQLKVLMTPLKLALFICGLIVAIVALAHTVRVKLRT